MKREDAFKEIVDALDDEIVGSNLGYISRELFKIGDRKENFYMLGSMGLASSIGLGIALASDRKVWVIEGDGSILMNLGTFSTISNYAPKNYTLIILDDSSYSSTGGQPTHTSLKTDLISIAKGMKLNVYSTLKLKDVLMSIKNIDGPHVIVAKIKPSNTDAPKVSLPPEEIKRRIMEALKC